MRKLLVIFLVIWGTISACSAAVPRLIIVQKKDQGTDTYDPNVAIATIIAAELDEEGKVEPVVWSLTDPIFRKALEQQLLVSPPEIPTLDYAADSLGKLQAEYLLFVKAIKQQDGVAIEAELYKGKRQIWKDKNRVTFGGGNAFDQENAVRSGARTWAIKMSAEPFKDLPSRRMQGTPDPETNRTQQNTDVVVPPAPNRQVDNADLKNRVNQMLALGSVSSAVNILRDAVDSEPLDAERRRMLIQALMQIGEAQLAAVEARRAAGLFPEQSLFRVLAARAWLEAGNLEEATQDINEAVAHDANSPEIRLLMGEISLKGLRYETALDHFNESIAKKPSSDAFFKRALAKAMMGDLAGCGADMAEANKLEPSLSPGTVRERYAFAVNMIDAMVDQTAADIRSLFQRTRLNAKEQELPRDCAILMNRITAIKQLLTQFAVPKVHTNSNDVRTLALKLLLQCLGDAKGSFGTLDEGVLDDATINLGEALKSYARAKESYSNERQAGEQPG